VENFNIKKYWFCIFIIYNFFIPHMDNRYLSYLLK
jgi:hypothetical protein